MLYSTHLELEYPILSHPKVACYLVYKSNISRPSVWLYQQIIFFDILMEYSKLAIKLSGRNTELVNRRIKTSTYTDNAKEQNNILSD